MRSDWFFEHADRFQDGSHPVSYPLATCPRLANRLTISVDPTAMKQQDPIGITLILE